MAENLGQLLPTDPAQEGTVAIVHDEGPIVPMCELACAVRGSCFVPLDPTAPVEYLHHQTTSAQVSCFVTTEQYVSKVKELALRSSSERRSTILLVCKLGRGESGQVVLDVEVQVFAARKTLRTATLMLGDGALDLEVRADSSVLSMAD